MRLQAIFKSPISEKDEIETRSRLALSNHGKNIWSPLFYNKQVPIIFSSQNNIALSTRDSTKPSGELNFSDHFRKNDYHFIFNDCNLRIFREGILSFRFEFSQNDCQFQLHIEDFIHILQILEEECLNGYLNRIKNIINNWSNQNHPFNQLMLPLVNSDNLSLLHDVIDAATIKHSCIFLEKLSKNNTSNQNPKFACFFENGIIPGILNKSSWFEKYGRRYIRKIKHKNIGYRKDEVYITDKDSSLVILSDYWDDEKPLKEYIKDLMLATEMQLSKVGIS